MCRGVSEEDNSFLLWFGIRLFKNVFQQDTIHLSDASLMKSKGETDFSFQPSVQISRIIMMRDKTNNKKEIFSIDIKNVWKHAAM